MGERTRKKPQGWKKACLHFCMCFFIGFFTGFAPANSGNKPHASNVTLSEIPTIHSFVGEAPVNMEEDPEIEASRDEVVSRRQMILITPTIRGGDTWRLVLLRRLARTVKLVPPPVTWIVVEEESGSEEVSEMLRKTGVMYRHLVVKENFTAAEMEMEYQRNVALKHVEHHRLAGIVHFAELLNVYDLDFFREIRKIEVFGTWPIALLSEQRDKAIIQGPVCDSSKVSVWNMKNIKNETDEKTAIHISSFAFNSSILWDPERWGRTSSTQGAIQDSIKFVKEAMNEDESSMKGIPEDKCSRILLWQLFPFPTSWLS